MKKFLLYALRWQASSPILALCLCVFANLGPFLSTVIANAIGAGIFFFVDMMIFKEEK